MANNRPTLFQNLNKLMRGNSVPDMFVPDDKTYGTPSPVIYSTNNKEDYDRKMEEIRQQKLLSYHWVKAGADTAMEGLAGLNGVKLMYRDSDLMESMPEIGAALDIYSEEACCLNSKGRMLNVYSKSSRIKAILEDLFVNRLNINVTLPMVCRGMCKYGNEFMLLNIDQKNGIMGWKRLNVFEIERIENGYSTSTMSMAMPTDTSKLKPDEVKFVWLGHNESKPYWSWEIAHFRMLNDSFFLPYGTSILHKARRSWRMWSMMEDAMLIYRLDRSIERRVFKIYVGGIDDADVKPYIDEIANNFKRTPIIDPQTGQIDLRKNFMDVSTDYFIPVRTENAPNPIETLQAAQNTTAMDDIKYMQNKVFAALRVPKAFLNFQESQGRGQNLSLLDIRFCRMVNKIQQYLLLELNKIAMLHLFIMGFEDDIANFTLSMNNPSAQIEALELEDLTKRVQAASTALADPGNGMPMMSWHRVMKDIMKFTEDDIKDMLNEMRLEKALANELMATQQVITKTGMFDATDNLYRDFSKDGSTQQPMQNQQGGPMGPGAGAPMGGSGMGGVLNSDSLGVGPGAGEDMSGEESNVPINQAPDVDNGTPLQESNKQKKKNLVEHFMKEYFTLLDSRNDDEETVLKEDYVGKNMSVVKELQENIKQIDEISSRFGEKADMLEEELNSIKDKEELKKLTKKKRTK